MGTNGFVRSGGRVWVGTVLLPVLLLAAVAGGGRWALAQDGTPDPETTGDAAIRLVHASPDAGPVDVYVNDELVVAGLDYPDVSDFLFRPAGVYDIAVTAAGDAVEDALIEADGVAVEAGRAYHIATVGTLAEDDDADLQTRVHEVNLDEVPDGQARVRVVHASPDAGTVDVAVNDEVPPPFVGVAYPDASEEIEVAAGSYDLELRATGTDDALLALSADLEAGNVYSLYAVGRVADDTLDVLTVASGPEAAQVTAGRPAHIHQGGCDDLGEIIENGTLNNPVAPQGRGAGPGGGGRSRKFADVRAPHAGGAARRGPCHQRAPVRIGDRYLHRLRRDRRRHQRERRPHPRLARAGRLGFQRRRHPQPRRRWCVDRHRALRHRSVWCRAGDRPSNARS